MTDPVSAVGAAGSAAPARAAAPIAPAGKAFGSYMEAAASSALDTLRAGEQAMLAGLEGKAGAQEVVTAVMAAETTLQTVVAIRDKALSAYNTLLNMPV